MQNSLHTQWVKRRLGALEKRHTDLAVALGLSPSKLSRTLRGDRRLQVSEMFALCEFLEISVEEASRLFLGEDALTATEPKYPNDQEKDVLESRNVTAGDVGGWNENKVKNEPSLELIERVARYVIEANKEYGEPQSSAQLASTIAQFCTSYNIDVRSYDEFEKELRETIKTAVRFTPRPIARVRGK